MSDSQRAPRRLLELGGPAADCLRQALAESELMQPLPSFARLRELRLRRGRRQRGLAVIALAAMVVVFVLRAPHKDEPPPSIDAEVATWISPGPAAVASSLADEPSRAPRPLDGTVGKLPAPASVSRKPAVLRQNEGARPEPVASAAVEGGGVKSCAQLARSGSAPVALECYAKLGGGTGMTAELALFEQARLEGKVLRRPDRALLVLEDYRRRFPAGTLRAEVMLAQIDWLVSSGDSVHALQVVNEALDSGLLRERAAELERLRTTLSAAPASASVARGATP